MTCTCTNCIFLGDGRRYCYDCKEYTRTNVFFPLPTKQELASDRRKEDNAVRQGKRWLFDGELIEDE